MKVDAGTAGERSLQLCHHAGTVQGSGLASGPDERWLVVSFSDPDGNGRFIPEIIVRSPGRVTAA